MTGGARGLGVEVCRQLAQAGMLVWLSARSLQSAETQAARLRADGDVRPVELDVTSVDSIARAVSKLDRLDVLVNNAAIDYDTDQSATEADLDRVHRALETNLLGAWRTAQACIPLLRQSAHGRLVNVSSQAGAITEMGAGLPGYQVSKLALNGLTRILAGELRTSGILVNSVCPGWTATDMGGGGRAIADGARSITWACLLDDDGPTGGFFRDGRPVPW